MFKSARKRELQRFRRNLIQHVQLLEDRRVLAYSQELLADINTDLFRSAPADFTEVGAVAFFTAETAAAGRELWKTDGTSAGTMLVKDIYEGASSNPTLLTNIGGTLFFTATSATGGRELWMSDGTAGGTVQVKDIRPGTSSSNPRELVNFGGTLFFGAGGASGFDLELWKSDGTEAGTVLVKDINPGSGSSSLAKLTNVGGTLFFSATDGTTGVELWKSDGTAAGTSQVKEIFSGSIGSYINYPTNVGGVLYFSASDAAGGEELWKSDGTSAGTVQVKDIRPGGFGGYPRHLVNVGGTLFFSAFDPATGQELWKSDGTAAGTVPVKDILPSTSSSSPTQLTNVGGTLFFVATDGTNGLELWKSNGTANGTVLVKNINPSADSAATNLINSEGTLFFTATDGTHGLELWKSDATSAGTVLVKDLAAGAGSSSPTNFANLGGRLLFSALNPAGRNELWQSNGTAAGTVLVKDGDPAASSYPRSMTNIAGTLFFSAQDALAGSGLWKSDGTAAGTTQVKDISGNSPSGPAFFADVNGILFFTAWDETGGRELWKSDGTAAGTVRVKDIEPGSGNSSPEYLTNVGGTLYFTAYNATTGQELWKSNGTDAGTVQVKDIYPGTTRSFPNNLTNVGGTLFFSAMDKATDEYELWKSDGTAAGTVRVPMQGHNPSDLTNVGGLLFFAAGDAQVGYQLWRSDGTAAGTVRLTNMDESLYGSLPYELTDVGGTVYFSIIEPAGRELWKSDGTIAGTTRVKDIVPGPSSGSPRNLANVGGVLYFTAADAASGLELWRSDGTDSGTVQVKDIYPGTGNGNPRYLTDAGGALLFMARDPLLGYGLWESDGTAEGTIPVALNGDQRPQIPQFLTAVGNAIYFSAYTDRSGRELFRATRPSSPPVLSNLGSPLAYEENQSALLVASAAVLSDPDSTNLNGGTLTVTVASGTDANDRLEIRDRTGIPDSIGVAGSDITYNGVTIGTYTGGTGSTPLVVTLNANATAERVQALLRAVTFRTLGESPSTATRQVEFIVTDGAGGTSNTGVKSVAVTPVNDAPVLDTSVAVNLNPIAEDSTPAGTLVSSLLGGITDVDAGAVKGIAVSSANNTAGTWQYTLDGTNWLNFGAVSRGAVRLLPANATTRVRLLPKANFNGTASLWFFAWDQTSGPSGGTADLTPAGTTGGRTAFSTNVRQAFLSVTAVNDAPKLNTGVAVNLDSIAEDSTPAGTLVSSLLGGITDVDAGALKGVAVSSANNTAGTWQYTLDGTNWLNFGGVSRGAVRLLAADATTRVRLLPKANFNGTASLWFFAWDQTSGAPGGTADLNPADTTGGTTAFSTNVRQAFLSVTAVNDAPKLNTAVAVNLEPIPEDSTPAGTLVSSLLGGITDVDAGALKGIAVSSANNTTGTWQYTLDGTNWLNFGAVSRGAVRLLAADATTRVRLLPKANFNGTASLWFFAWDQTSGTPGGMADLTPAGTTGGTTAFSTTVRQAFLSVTPVNDAPVLGGTSGSLGYKRNDPAVVLAPNATVADIDSANFGGGQLRVRITQGGGNNNTLAIGSSFTIDAGNNVWFGDTAIGKRLSNGIGTNELKIQFYSTATKALVQQLVRSITYRNVGGSAGTRSITFTVSDGDGGLSEEQVKTVNVT